VSPALAACADAIRGASNCWAITGAGISVPSGIPDFRSENGLWQRYDPMEVLSLSHFMCNATKTWELLREIFDALSGKRPNPAHTGLAQLESRGLLSGVFTQNIDGLHQAAGSTRVYEVHGNSLALHCLSCGFGRAMDPTDGAAVPYAACPTCESPLKPDVVFFEEMVRHMDEAAAAMERCDVLLILGTSAQVYPVAALPRLAMVHGAALFEFNLAATDFTLDLGATLIAGDVAKTVPELIAAIGT
jgi:NAD-dependent deacetylase